ncbi:MAG: YdcF family protein [Proteobacteria bacterium]|nr:YdcF family protein [Pseudomonadota bacterium]
MLFIISKLLWLIAAPSMMLLILAWLGLLLMFRRHREAGLACLTVSLGAMAIITLLPVGDALLAPLENRFPEVTTLPAKITGIIVLGGAIETDISAARGMPSLNGAAERMTSLVYLARHYPDAKLAFTGGNGELIHAPMTEAAVARQLFTELGVDQSRIVYESRSRTTYENAVDLKALLKPEPGQLWLLITSAWHMPRAVGLFRHAGWSVLPYPVGYKTAPGPMTEIRGSFPDRLAMVDMATHEWVGLVAYWLLGRTSALFPAPQGTTPR